MRGIIGKKLGMTQLFDPESGAVTPVTVIEAGPCPVVSVKEAGVHGYDAVQVAFDEVAEDRLSKPGSITPHTHFNAEVYVLSKDEGGRHTPFFNGYRPQFYFRTTDVTGSIKLPEGQEMVMPGDNTNMEIELIQPIAMDQGLRFAIREGGRTVGAGVVTKINK